MRSGTTQRAGNRRVGRSLRAWPRPRCPRNPSAWSSLRDKLKDRPLAAPSMEVGHQRHHGAPAAQQFMNISFAYVEGESLRDGYQRRRGFEWICLHFGNA